MIIVENFVIVEIFLVIVELLFCLKCPSPKQLLFVFWGGGQHTSYCLKIFVEKKPTNISHFNIISSRKKHKNIRFLSPSCLISNYGWKIPIASTIIVTRHFWRPKPPPQSQTINGQHCRQHQLRPVQFSPPKRCHQCQPPGRHKSQKKPQLTTKEFGKNTKSIPRE